MNTVHEFLNKLHTYLFSEKCESVPIYLRMFIGPNALTHVSKFPSGKYAQNKGKTNSL